MQHRRTSQKRHFTADRRQNSEGEREWKARTEVRVLKLKSARDLQPSFAETASASRRQHTVHTRGPSREANAFWWLAELGHLEIEFVNCISIIAKTRSRIVWRALAR